MPFSKLEYDTTFLIITARCKNLYNYIINSFSKIYTNLSKHFLLKKFIYSFICIPAKWIRSSRADKLRIYGKLQFKKQTIKAFLSHNHYSNKLNGKVTS